MVVAGKHSEIGVNALLGVIISQAWLWPRIRHQLLPSVMPLASLLTHRNSSVISGLLIVLSGSLHRRKIAFAGLPELQYPTPFRQTERTFQFANRVLLIFLFLGFIFKGDKWTFLRMIVSTVGLLACVMIVVGFKAK